MSIKEKYQNLINKNLDLQLIDEAKTLRDECVLAQNKEFYYLVNILIIDIYIEYNKLDDALKLITKDFSNIDSSVFRNIYVSYLERLIYIYINKRNFTVAFGYVFEKRKYIDEKNRDDVNRWYLEMAYVYAEMNQKAKAVDNLKAILENLPNDELLSLTLNNLTKLYIDQNMIEEAKDALNQSLIVTKDEEGKLYCNYLLAKISVLEEKYEEALLLYQEIFIKEINPEFLSITNDYLDLLLKLNLYDEADSFIEKIKKNIENSEDLVIKKEFYKNKLKLILLKSGITTGKKVLNQIEELENTILTKNALDLEETFEDDKNNEVYTRIKEVIFKIEHIINLISLTINTDNLRDFLMDYGKKLDSIIPLEEISFVFYDDLTDIIDTKQNISAYNYKKERLFEREFSYDDLKRTIVESVIANGNEIAIDLKETKLNLIDLDSQQNFNNLRINYLYAVPNFNNDNMFATVVYKANQTDLISLENNIILKLASKLLEFGLINLKQKTNEEVYKYFFDRINKNYNLYTIIHYNEKLLLSDELKKLLEIETDTILKNEYLEKIVESDVSRYQELDFDSLNEKKIKYRLKIGDKYLQVEERLSSYKSLFVFSTLSIEKNKVFTSINDDAFNETINELKTKINNIEFKFSLIRIDGDINDFEKLNKVFGIAPYYLSDGTFAIILENEVNQRSLDKYFKQLDNKVSVVRFPRDLVDIDEVVKFSKIGLENEILYFSDDAYQEYLKKVSINKLVEKSLSTAPELYFLELKTFNNKPAYEVRSNINGLTEKDDVRIYLTKKNLEEYDIKVFKNLIQVNIKVNYFINLSIEAVNSLIKKNSIKPMQNFNFCLDGEGDVLSATKTLKEVGVKVYLNYHILNNLNIYDLMEMNLDGIIINEGIDSNKRSKIIKLAESLDLNLLTNYKFNDYQKCIYRTNNTEREV